MARTRTQADEENPGASARSDNLPVCGVIMPISATANHAEDHWRDVQSLLHRGISAAGFKPENVWDNTSTDRVSERIIGNIFNVPIAVADISELNPNVMLELGLRLASKKPTVVIVNSGGSIPFDIRDFHAIFYPSDMNILGMEEFFRKLSKVLKEKFSSFGTDAYTPFLGSVIVDVASPETREVGFNELLLSRFDDIADRMVRLESVVRPLRRSSSTPSAPIGITRSSGIIHFEIPADYFEEASGEFLEQFEFDRVIETSNRNGIKSGVVHFSAADSVMSVHQKAEEILNKWGGSIEVPF